MYFFSPHLVFVFVVVDEVEQPTASEIFSQPLSISPVILPRGNFVSTNSPAVLTSSGVISDPTHRTATPPIALPELSQVGKYLLWKECIHYFVVVDSAWYS